MAKIRQEAGRFGLVGINTEWVLPPRYDSLKLVDIDRHYYRVDAHSGIQYVLQRVIADNRHGLVCDEDPSEACGFSKVLLEPVCENLQIRKTDAGTYEVIADGKSGRLRHGRWTDPLKSVAERKRLKDEAKTRDEERQRRWDEGAARRESAEEKRRLAIQAKRKASGCCIMCGYPLGPIGKLLRKAHHPACVRFDSSMSPRERAKLRGDPDFPVHSANTSPLPSSRRPVGLSAAAPPPGGVRPLTSRLRQGGGPYIP